MHILQSSGLSQMAFCHCYSKVKTNMESQVCPHKSTVLRAKGQGDVALPMKDHRISQDGYENNLLTHCDP